MTNQLKTIEIEIPQEYKRLFDSDWREAAVYGGRFSLKSHTVARVLLIKARMNKTRVACFREFQNSISESSHQLLKDLIELYDLKDFEVTDKSIINKINGSDFLFKGLHRNEQNVKSTEGIDIAWVEEAQTVSKSSLEVLTPTIRKAGSQIIYTYNRLLEIDPVHERLVLEGRPNTLIINENYDIALKYGFMPDSVRLEMEDDKEKRPALYQHKWMGEPNNVEGRIYKDWEIIDDIPHEARLWRRGLDFGYTIDPTVMVDIYEYNGGYIIDEIIYAKGLSNKSIADVINNQTEECLVIADSAEPKSIDEISSYGVSIVGAKKGPGSVSQGISVVQAQKISITRKSNKTITAYQNYMWSVDKRSTEHLPIPDDTIHEWSNSMDCLVAGTKIKTIDGYKPIENVTTNEYVYTRDGLRQVKDSWLVKKNAQVIKLVLSNSKQLTGTPNHRIWTSKGWQHLTALRYGDIVYVWETKSYTKEEITSVTQRKRNSITTMVVSFFIDVFGKKPMAIYQKVIISITRMVLKQITDWQISHLLTKRNTDKTTLEQEHQSQRVVTLVERTLSLRPEEKVVGSAQTNVRVNGGEITKLTLLKRFVLFVAKSLCKTSINLPRLVPVSVVGLKDEKEKRSVYDITVNDCNEYFAGDILVHNSIRYGFNGGTGDGRAKQLQQQRFQSNKHNIINSSNK